MFLKDNKWFLYGITSLVLVNDTTRFCEPTQPSFFTAVPAFAYWINKTIGEI
jgi:hypothetical protein